MSDDRIIRIEDKIDRLTDRISSIDSTLAAQHESLKLHMRRSDLLEQQIEPIKSHVAGVKGVLKFLGILAVVAAIAESVKIVFGK